MKPIDIFKALDLALAARSLGSDRDFIPAFVGDAGLGKSKVCQAWVKEQQKKDPNFFFLDLRLAYMEAPDVIGLPSINGKGDAARTTHSLPEFWPTEGKGLILFEEPNRSAQSVMNTMMQVLTDRRIHNYKLPEGMVVALALNPEQGYEVNSMDTALKNRVVLFNIDYDHKSFLEFIEKDNWHPNVINFVKSGAWIYKSPSEIGTEGQYISPRTLNILSNAEHAGLSSDTDFHFQTSVGILGKAVGNSYYKFVFDNAPVMVADILADKAKAFKKLEAYADPKNRRGDLLGVTVDSIAATFKDYPNNTVKVTDDILAELVDILPLEQYSTLLRTIVGESNVKWEVLPFAKAYPKVREALVKHRESAKTLDEKKEKANAKSKSKK